MQWYRVVLLLVQLVYVNSDISSFLKYGNQHSFHTLEEELRGHNADRSKRFINFHNDESNIRVEIEFSVPFLEIPLGDKGSQRSPGGRLLPKLSINAKSAIVVATFFIASYFILPKLVHHFLPKVNKRYRERGSEEYTIDRLVQGVEAALHVNTTACWQQGVCFLVRGSRDNTTASGLGKVLDGISSMGWVENMAKGTALDEAFVSAKQNPLGCQDFYLRCILES